MGTTQYFEANLYPPNQHGRAEESGEGTLTEVLITNFYGDHQIFLRMKSKLGEQTLHLTKIQALELSAALASAESTIGYDNSGPMPEDER